jgi:hypothetical protein
VIQIAFARRAIAALALAIATPTFGAAATEFNGVAPGSEFQPYDGAPVVDAYKAPAPAWAIADGGYGSQGFHHGLPETSLLPETEPVAGDSMPD